MFKKSMPRLFVAVIGATLSMNAAYAQDSAPAETPKYEAPAPYSPSWSDDGIAKIADALSGTWKTASEVNGEDAIMMSVSPAPVENLNDTFYVESVRASTPWEPYRQAIFQLYRYKGNIRLRTYEFAIGDQAQGVFNSMGSATELFPELSADDLIATLDVELQSTSSGFTGATPYPYPTGVAGAVEMTSSITLDGDSMSVADRGFDADGNVVWGADANSAYTFNRSEPYTTVTRSDDGMVIIDYSVAENGIQPQEGDRLHVHYDGYLTDGTRFDSSYARNQPFVFTYPPRNRAISGWGIGMDGYPMGNHRKLVIPGYLGYGTTGNPRVNIPPNATLLFNTFMAHIDHIEAEPAETEPAMNQSNEAESKED